ncbi:helix-turn-helix domain-containing protein [Telluribacter sp. SYSU D00476]|uniref:helix-turn-helix domain-containing protein n=1 Tax=Telluribacter sp. SYSU D00476 TaxID=2811430 RepID=UPI001FF3238C|nr:helix-turn-helix domain-containing protein [Telluribacter sp. SYSU D00476]
MSNPFEIIDRRLSNIEELLLDIKHTSFASLTHPKEEDEMLTVQQAAKLLDLTVPTVYGHVHKANIPVCKRGNRLYFSKHELTEWLKAGRRKTVDEIRDEASHYKKGKGVKNGR